MTIEQKSELNRFIDPSIPLTWAKRWHQFKISLPVLAFIWACLIEMGLLKAWLANRLTLDFVMILAGCCLAFPVFIMVMAEIQIQIQHRSRRVIKFADKNIIIKPSKNASVPWTKVERFRFEPIPQAAGLTKFTLFLKGFPKKNQKRRAFWSMVLEDNEQSSDLIQYLQRYKIETATSYEIERLQQPAPAETRRPFSLLGLSLYMGGCYLLLHGGPMLLGVLDHGPHEPTQNSKFSPEEIAKFAHFLTKHFSSKDEFRYFFLSLSIGLVLAGGAVLVSGWRLMNHKPSDENTLTNL